MEGQCFPDKFSPDSKGPLPWEDSPTVGIANHVTDLESKCDQGYDSPDQGDDCSSAEGEAMSAVAPSPPGDPAQALRRGRAGVAPGEDGAAEQARAGEEVEEEEAAVREEAAACNAVHARGG